MPSEPLLRIGELSKRTGVSVELLRAWERRYGLLRPRAHPAGLRLYAAADVERVRLHAAAPRRRAGRRRGGRRRPRAPRTTPPAALSWADAARRARRRARPLRRAAGAGGPRPAAGRRHAGDAARRGRAALPARARRALGARRGHRSPRSTSPPPSCAAGCSASHAAGASGIGPTAVLACLPGEHHDLGLIAFGLALRAQRLAHRLSRPRRPDRHGRGHLPPPRTGAWSSSAR